MDIQCLRWQMIILMKNGKFKKGPITIKRNPTDSFSAISGDATFAERWHI
jgi:hypothetical protein